MLTQRDADVPNQRVAEQLRREGKTVTAPDTAMRLTASIGCSGCQRSFTGTWAPGKRTAAQDCPRCGRTFKATWPGFTFQPDSVIVADTSPCETVTAPLDARTENP